MALSRSRSRLLPVTILIKRGSPGPIFYRGGFFAVYAARQSPRASGPDAALPDRAAGDAPGSVYALPPVPDNCVS
jgi:hypothetical protein